VSDPVPRRTRTARQKRRDHERADKALKTLVGG
jgi:hypothetical protein